jgi:hypothetical protein
MSPEDLEEIQGVGPVVGRSGSGQRLARNMMAGEAARRRRADRDQMEAQMEAPVKEGRSRRRGICRFSDAVADLVDLIRWRILLPRRTVSMRRAKFAKVRNLHAYI